MGISGPGSRLLRPSRMKYLTESISVPILTCTLNYHNKDVSLEANGQQEVTFLEMACEVGVGERRRSSREGAQPPPSPLTHQASGLLKLKQTPVFFPGPVWMAVIIHSSHKAVLAPISLQFWAACVRVFTHCYWGVENRLQLHSGWLLKTW